MIGGLILICICTGLAFAAIAKAKKHFPFVDSDFLKKIFFYHLVLSLVYYLYVIENGSDSQFYYQKILIDYRGPSWSDFYGTSTPFIEWLGYPVIKYLNFSYEAVMALFSFIGFLGFLFFYLFFKENIRFQHKFLSFDLVSLVFFLPNFHFWSASFGKGAVIFLALGMFFFSLAHFRSRIITLVIASIIIYHVRPHIMLVVLVSAIVSLVFSSKTVSISWRLLIMLIAIASFFFIYRDVLQMVGIDEEEFLTQGMDLSHRAKELSKATSGVDISSYSLPFQLFTFLYRPLFIDAPGMLGIIVSFENFFYLIITLQFLFNFRNWKLLMKSDFLVKSAFLSFITISIALAQVSGNLGLAMRQKSQVMILFLFVIISIKDYARYIGYQRNRNKAHVPVGQIPNPSS